MSNLGTMVYGIRTRCHKSSSDDANIRVAIFDAIALLRGKNLKWNQARFALTLVTDQASYGLNAAGAALATKLPFDLLAILGKALDLDYTGLADQRTPVLWVPRESMDAHRRGTTVSGEPFIWTFWDEKLEIYPPSDNSTNILRGAYRSDVGTPTYALVSGALKYYRPAGTELTAGAVLDAYGSGADYTPWFDPLKGFNIVSWKAEWDLWTSYWQASAGQDSRASLRYVDYLAEAEELSELQSAGRQLQPWIPDYAGM